jgi:hypothetical protein
MQPSSEEPKRHSGTAALIVLGVAGLAIAWAMYLFGIRALDMDPEARGLNNLLKEQSLSCAEPVDPVKCAAARRAVDDYIAEMERRKLP